MKKTDILKFLFFVTKPYSFPILEPLQNYINKTNCGKVYWFLASTARDYECPGNELKHNDEVMQYGPDVVVAPGNIIPDFWSGLKVQIFHGLDDEVKGFYNISGFFDLYCTTGPEMTENFLQLSKKYRHFHVIETGWPKLDPIYSSDWEPNKKKICEQFGLNDKLPIILYAPTFPQKYTSAFDLYEVIRDLKQYTWIIKFHSMMNEHIKNRYLSLQSDNLFVLDEVNILPLMAASDILVTDTSSVAYEFLHFDKPIITYKAKARKDKGLNIVDPIDLFPAIERCLNDPDEFKVNRKIYMDDTHPYYDGNSSNRLIDGVQKILVEGLHKTLKNKPLNILRKYQIRKIVKSRV